MDDPSAKGSTVWVVIQCERLKETKELKEKREVHFGPSSLSAERRSDSIALGTSVWTSPAASQ